MNDDIHQQENAKDRDERIDAPAREGVLQPSPDDEADIEEPVAEDRIGKRRGYRQEDERQHGRVAVAKMSAPGFRQ